MGAMRAVTREDERELITRTPKRLLIGGDWVDGDGMMDVEDPSTGEVLCVVADAAAVHAEAAMDACAEAAPAFARTPPGERSRVLHRTAALLHEHREDMALLITLEMGKTLREARAEVDYAASYVSWYAEEAVRIEGRWSVAPDGGSRMLVTQHPVGPCCLITPWNFALAMGARKIAPAIAAGCTMVVKPAPQTPLTMLRFAELLLDAGLAPGVVNVLSTSRAEEVGEALLGDPRLRKLSFTGSTRVGRALTARAADNLLRVSMELGGNAPFLVFDDADVGAAVEGAVQAKMRNMGEACTAANRFHVHESVAEEFTAGLAHRLGGLRLGRGSDERTDVGPLIDAAQHARVASLVDEALGRGARAVTGGAVNERAGHFYEPTVLADVPADARMLREEIFGPVAPVVTFADDDEAVRAANAGPHGLASYIYTSRIDRAIAVSEQLEVGMVALNRGVLANAHAPFGGTKQSGFGREGGREGIREYLEPKYVAIDV